MRFFRSAAAQPLTPSAEIQMSAHADALPDLRIAAALLVPEDGCTLPVASARAIRLVLHLGTKTGMQGTRRGHDDLTWTRRERRSAAIPRLERTVRAAAVLLLDRLGIERAVQVRQAFELGSGGAVESDAGQRFGGEDLTGAAAADGLLPASERQLAGAGG